MAVLRRRWDCPKCGIAYEIPSDAADPLSCPKCRPSAGSGCLPVVRWVPVSRTRKRSRMIWPILAAAAVIAILIGRWVFSNGFGVRQQLGRAELAVRKVIDNGQLKVPVADHEFALVDEYLKENLDDPNYEVVKWWTSDDQKMAAKRKAESIQKMIDAANPKDRFEALRVSEMQNELEAVQAISEDTLCRLKFRTTNEFGAKVLKDMTFVIYDGKARPLPWHNQLGYWPDDE
jgi:hypothetical protein